MKLKTNKNPQPYTLNPIPLVVIVGPTGSGKSDLALHLAKKCNGEIVSADSRQVYRGLDIGSGKVTKKEQKEVVHHLLDVASPGRRFTVAQFKKKADTAVRDIWRRGKLPFLVGGTHLYVKAVVEGYNVPEVKPDQKLRKELEYQSLENLLALLKKFDSVTYARIDKKNPRRIIRALEIIYHTGKSIPALKKESPYEALLLGIDMPREEFYKRIDRRVDERMKKGMVGEVKNLIKTGVSKKWLKSLGLEYRFLTEYLVGEITKTDAIEKVKNRSHDFARRQLTWYRKEKQIQWIRSQKEAYTYTKDFLRHLH